MGEGIRSADKHHHHHHISTTALGGTQPPSEPSSIIGNTRLLDEAAAPLHMLISLKCISLMKGEFRYRL